MSKDLEQENTELRAFIQMFKDAMYHYNRASDLNPLMLASTLTPEDCLAEHDKKVAKKALNDFLASVKSTYASHDDLMLQSVQYHVTNYLHEME